MLQHLTQFRDGCHATLLWGYSDDLPMQPPICITSTMLCASPADSTRYEALQLISSSTAGTPHVPLTHDLMSRLLDDDQRASGRPPTCRWGRRRHSTPRSRRCRAPQLRRPRACGAARSRTPTPDRRPPAPQVSPPPVLPRKRQMRQRKGCGGAHLFCTHDWLPSDGC
jgi:hypothetical protein